MSDQVSESALPVCPTCGSHDPRLHPATQAEGEVTAVCQDPFHARPSPERPQGSAAPAWCIRTDEQEIHPAHPWVRDGVLVQCWGWPEPGSVTRICPSCGALVTMEPYDIGSGPELACPQCEWCWGADGQPLQPYRPPVTMVEPGARVPVCIPCGHRHQSWEPHADHQWDDACPYEGTDCLARRVLAYALQCREGSVPKVGDLATDAAHVGRVVLEAVAEDLRAIVAGEPGPASGEALEGEIERQPGTSTSGSRRLPSMTATHPPVGRLVPSVTASGRAGGSRPMIANPHPRGSTATTSVSQNVAGVIAQLPAAPEVSDPGMGREGFLAVLATLLAEMGSALAGGDEFVVAHVDARTLGVEVGARRFLLAVEAVDDATAPPGGDGG